LRAKNVLACKFSTLRGNFQPHLSSESRQRDGCHFSEEVIGGDSEIQNPPERYGMID
jgi:hypothetical protein